MQKKVNKLIGIGVALSVLSSIGIGCGKKQDISVQANIKSEKPSKITWAVVGYLKDEDGKQACLDKFKELTGTELELFSPTNNQFYEKLDIAFSSGSAPDLISAGSNLSKYVNQNLLLDLDKYVQNSKGVKKIDSKLLDSVKMNGKVYGIPNESGTGTVTYVRKDWLDKLGLKEPKSYDEFYKMLQGFKSMKSPNNATTIPYIASGLMGVNCLIDFYQDARPDFTKKNGKWVDGFTEPEMKAALDRLASAYKDGLLDTEIFTNKTSDSRDKFFAGRVGVFNYWAGTWADTLNKNLKNGPAGESASIVPIKPIKEVKYMVRQPSTISINAKAKNPDGIWNAFFETMLDGEDGSRLFSAGVESIHYQAKENNKMKQLPLKSNPKENCQKSFFEDYLYPVPLKYTFDYNQIVTDSRKILLDDMVRDELIPTSKTMTKKGADILALKESLMAQAIKGKISSEEAINQYKAKSQENMTAQIIEELNK